MKKLYLSFEDSDFIEQLLCKSSVNYLKITKYNVENYSFEAKPCFNMKVKT